MKYFRAISILCNPSFAVLWIMLAGATPLYSQLSGTFTVPGNFSTLAAAIESLNTQGVGAGGATILLQSGNPQTAPPSGYIIGGSGSPLLNTTSVNNPVIINGNGNTITASNAHPVGSQADAVFKIVGADFITIRNCIIQEHPSNGISAPIASNTLTDYAIGIFPVSATDGAQHNTIQNISITLKGNIYPGSIGILSTSSNSHTHGTLEATSSAGTNSYNRFYSNTINNVAYGMYFICPPVTTTVFETGIDIGGNSASTGNTITFGNSNPPSNPNLNRFSSILPAGIYFRNGGAGCSVRYNTITSNQTSYIQSGGIGGLIVTTSQAPNVITYETYFSNNTITLTNQFYSAITGIDFGYGSNGGSMYAAGNTIQLFQTTSYNVSATIIGLKSNYKSNTTQITGNSITIQQQPSGTGTNSSPVTGIMTSNEANQINVSNNSVTIKQLSPQGLSSYGSGTINFIVLTTASTAASVTSNQLNTAGFPLRSSGNCFGINHNVSFSAGIAIEQNIIQLSRMAATGSIFGIYETNGVNSVSYSIQQNQIVLSQLSGESAAYGIQTLGGSATAVKNISANSVHITGSNSGITVGIVAGNSTNSQLSNNSVTINTASESISGLQATATATGLYLIAGNNLSLNSSSASVTSFTGIRCGSTGPFEITSNQISAIGCPNLSAGSPGIMGIQVSAGNGNKIYNNILSNFTAGFTASQANPVIHGIVISGGLLTDVYNNKIYGLTSLCSGNQTLVSGISIQAGTTNNLYNNLIGGLFTPNAANPDAIRGINITSTIGNTTHNVYHNTVAIWGGGGPNFGSTGIYHTASSNATTSRLNLANNIIVNRCNANGSGIASAFRRSGIPLENYGSVSDNNNFYAPVIMFNGSVSFALKEFKTLVAPRDAASFSEDPVFLSLEGNHTLFLHINESVPTLIESGGKLIPGITTDFDGNIRWGNSGYPPQNNGGGIAPDVGADEFDGIPQITQKAVEYLEVTQASVANVYPGSVNHEILKIEIMVTNGAGSLVLNSINIHSLNSNDEDVTAVKLFFTDNDVFSTGHLLGNTSFQSGLASFQSVGFDLPAGLSYLWVAYDVAESARNFRWLDAKIPANQINIGGSFFPVSDKSPAGARQIIGPLQHTVTIPGTFPTITGGQGLFSYINAYGLRGNVTAVITGNLTEPGIHSLNQWIEFPAGSLYQLIIRPDSAVSRIITGSIGSGLIRLIGADRVTIDGSIMNEGRYLHFSNTNQTETNSVIWIGSSSNQNGASHNLIRHCIIQGSGTEATMAGIFSGHGTLLGTASQAPNSYNAFHNNLITRCEQGIVVRGPAEKDSELDITQNILGSEIFQDRLMINGIEISQQEGAIVSQNLIQGVISNTGEDLSGIRVSGNVVNTAIEKNSIRRIHYTGTVGITASGLWVGSSENHSNLVIANNEISDILSYGAANYGSGNGYGILVETGGIKLYYNTVHLATNQPASVGIPASLLIKASVTEENSLEVINNIFSITSTQGSNRYAVLCLAGQGVFNVINHNLYFTTGQNLGYLGTPRQNIDAWRLITGQDDKSLETNPMFESDSELSPVIGSFAIGSGIPMASVIQDIIGHQRDTYFPTMGAHEKEPVFIWTGKVDNNWNNPDNWHPPAVPESNRTCHIDNSSVQPIIIGEFTIQNLVIRPGGKLTIEPGGALTVTGTISNTRGNTGLVIRGNSEGTGSLLHYTSDVNATIELIFP